MRNKIEIDLRDGRKLVASLYNHDGEHPEITVCIVEPNGLIHQDVCLIRPHENANCVQETDRVDCIVWGDKDSEDYTDKYVIDIYEEEE